MIGETGEDEQEMAFPLKPASGRWSGLSGKGPVPGVAALSILASILITAGPALADLSDPTSPHNFTGAGEPNIARRAGVCTPCHWMHYARDSVVRTWPRDLDDERIYFDQTSSPDYLPDSALLSSPTLLCYDCHIGVSPPVELQDPELTGWAGDPQDIAFTDGPPESGGTATGYYELSDGTIPDTGNSAPTDGSPTGGHFWKSEPTGTPDYARGDKLSCTMCHDPHDHDSRTGSNEVMFLMETPDGNGGVVTPGDGLKASSASRNGTGDGRGMCAACHGLSDLGSPETMWGVILPAPPSTVSEHSQSSAAQCTSCHPHNFVTPSGGDCEGCHGSSGPGPNVLTYWDGSWWDTNQGGNDSTNQGGHGDPDERPALACTDCHDTSDPPTGSGRHFNGILNSTGGITGTAQNQSVNTAHLLPAWIGDGTTQSNVQTTLDAACYGCHNSPWFLNDHSAEGGFESHAKTGNIVQFGLPPPPGSTTITDGESIDWPVDSDISTNASTAEPDYALCVTCHDPHGTGIPDHHGAPGTNSNFMLRGNFLSDLNYCETCHL
jgi:hypothetical protein